MAFTKTGIGIFPPVQIDLPLPEIGEELDGMVWDGEKWIPVSESKSLEPSEDSVSD